MMVSLPILSALALLPSAAAVMDKIDTGRKIGYVILIILGISVVLAVSLALWRRADIATEWHRRRMKRPVLPVDARVSSPEESDAQRYQLRQVKSSPRLPPVRTPPPAYSIDPTPEYGR